jgi:cyclic beta-1,2-glucan synthetase
MSFFSQSIQKVVTASRKILPGALAGGRSSMPLWQDRRPVRAELFSVERLESHALTLANSQLVTNKHIWVPALATRLTENAAVLLQAFRSSTAEVEAGRPVAPAAEWLLDNYHIVEQQIREIRDHLPPHFYRQLPKLATGPFAGDPRI